MRVPLKVSHHEIPYMLHKLSDFYPIEMALEAKTHMHIYLDPQPNSDKWKNDRYQFCDKKLD